MKKSIKYIITILFMFLTLLTKVGAVWTGFNAGNTTAGAGNGNGEFYSSYVGLKVSIVKKQDGSNEFIKSYKFFNTNVDNNLYYFSNKKPKFLQTDGGAWNQGCGTDCAYSDVLKDTYWNTVNFNSLLTDENIRTLVNIITKKDNSITIDDNTYIVAEPMIRLGNRYGTAFELMASYVNNTSMSCGEYSGFQSCYGATFYGASWSSPICQGCVYSTIHVTASNPFVTESDCDNNSSDYDSIYECKKQAIFDYWRGGSIGIYKASNLGIVQSKGKLKITKTRLNGNIITGKTAKFGIYENSNCSGNPKKEVSVTGTNTIELSTGTYYLKETKEPNGYVLDDTCKPFTITANTTTQISVKNLTPCESDFNRNSSKTNRIDLYKKYSFNQLLNFEITNASLACSTVTCDYTSSVGCLSANSGQTKNNTFNANNLSCYNETIDVNGKTGYCLTTFTLTNKLGKTRFSTFSGGMFINTSEPVAIGELTKLCYVYGDSTGNYSEDLVVDKYVGDISFFDKPLISDGGSSAPKFPLTTKRSDYYEYIFKYNINYTLNPVYLKKGTGEIIEMTSNTCTNCEFLGYGLISKLTDFGDNKIGFKISKVEGSILNFDSIKEENMCTYTAKKEIIEEGSSGGSNNNSQKLNLEFRIIDVGNPFPGKDGNGRNVGNNWCAPIIDADVDSDNQITTSDVLLLRNLIKNTNYQEKYDFNSDGKVDYKDLNILRFLLTGVATNNEIDFENKDCSSNNWLIKYYMTEMDNTKNNNGTAKYTIELDASSIKKIRNYNQGHQYGEFDTNSTSEFLETLKANGILTVTEQSIIETEEQSEE